MESSSIVSFNNDSTFQPIHKGDLDNIKVHELALHAMRDRCLLLQRRINTLENDNMRLKLDITKTTECAPYIPLQDDEKFLLHQKILELTKQKSQLMHHVLMVSCENKNLWSKIASLKGKSRKECTKKPLLRTNTYIQSNPKHSEEYQEKYSESSLEEISLKLINSYIQEKSQLVEQYEQMAQLQDDDENHILNVESIGFTYLEDPTMDSFKEIHHQTKKLLELKSELEQQENDLKFVISKVEAVLKDGHKCPTCIANSSKIVTSEHKEIETSDSLINWATPVDSSNYNENCSALNLSTYKRNLLENREKEFPETADVDVKMCPMCGQIFLKDVPFSEFQAHVEEHFTGNMDSDSNIDTDDNLPISLNDHV